MYFRRRAKRQTFDPNFAKMDQPIQGESSTFAKMDRPIQGESSSGTVALPLKRRRGRPLKDPSLKHVGRPQVPLRFESVQQIQPQQVNRNDGMVGQAVAGVVEAAFDGGYLLSIRIGDSNTIYRDVVFKPGHFVPVTADNDVAPHVPMIKRKVVHRPAENQLQVYGHRAEQNGNGSLVLGSRSSKGKQASIRMHPSVPPVGARGTVVPVVLQPVNLTNGAASSQGPHASSHASHVESIRERKVQMVELLAMLPPDGSVPSSQVAPLPTWETFPSQTQVSDKVTRGMGQEDDGSFSKGVKDMQWEEVKPVVSTNITVPVEAVKGPQGSAELPKTNTSNCETSPVVPEQGQLNHFPSAEPSEPADPPLHTEAMPVSKPLMNFGTGRVTELLQAVQENLMENQMLRAEESGHAAAKIPKTDGSKQETAFQYCSWSFPWN